MNILFIEDDAIEVMKLQRTVTKLKMRHHIREANNGEEALEILYSTVELPEIILLDLNMPRINGIEFLQILKEDEKLKYIPTIILTTSENRTDLLECYRIGIAGYIIKPLRYEEYESRLQKVLEYWNINELVKAL
jgi:CheY-like chemotaxis protein